MPRKRNRENAGFPTGWRWMNGAIRYQVPKGMEKFWDGKKQYTLGRTPSAAYTEWAKRVQHDDKVLTIGDLLQRYYLEVSTQKEPQSLKSDTRSYKELLKTFHNVHVGDITPQDIYKYINLRTAKIAARREKAMLSHAFTKAVEWGYIGKHPFKGEIRLTGEAARTRYLEDWEINAMLGMKPKDKGDILPVIQAYIALKLLLGLRQGDMLRLPEYRGKVGDIIPMTTQKTGKRIEIEVTEAVHAAMTTCMAIRPRDIAPWLFCTRNGSPYFNEATGDTSSWQSNWQRFKKRVETELGIKDFTEHDIRAKVGSDQPDAASAQKLLTHDNVATTNRAYRRKPERIKPSK